MSSSSSVSPELLVLATAWTVPFQGGHSGSEGAWAPSVDFSAWPPPSSGLILLGTVRGRGLTRKPVS